MSDIKKHLEELLGQDDQKVDLEELELFEQEDENGNEGALVFNVDEKYYIRYYLSFNDAEWFEIDDDGNEDSSSNGQEK
jgi:hypothetical protein